MRLKTHIIDEAKKVEYMLQRLKPDIQKVLKRDCKKYIQLLKQHDLRPFYRGIYEHIEKGEMEKKNVRKDRLPMGTPEHDFKLLNKWLAKNGHVRRDKSVSVSSSLWAAEEFGNGYLFFPIGKFNYTWIKAKDLNLDDIRTGWNQANVTYFFDAGEYELEMSNVDRKSFPKYFTTNKGIEKAWKNSYEVWFNCKSYYVISDN